MSDLRRDEGRARRRVVSTISGPLSVTHNLFCHYIYLLHILFVSLPLCHTDAGSPGGLSRDAGSGAKAFSASRLYVVAILVLPT